MSARKATAATETDDAKSGSEALSYEQARDELTDVVRALEAGGTTLEQSLALWERGEELARVCRARLDGARDALEKAMARRADEDAPADGEHDSGGDTEDDTEETENSDD